MLLPLVIAALLSALAHAQSSTTATSDDVPASESAVDYTGAYSRGAILSTLSGVSFTLPSATYLSYASQMTVQTQASFESYASASTGSDGITTSSATASDTDRIVGSAAPSSTTGTSATPSATNTTPCNGYPEFCTRKYSNITEVCAHNSAFSVTNNVFSNQQVSITGQLNDGIRMIQGQTHWVNNTIYSCHTSCDFLNAGTLEEELSNITSWVEGHPYDVVTILLGNNDFIDVGLYTTPIQNSGIGQYLYTPPRIPMYNEDWPELQDMILAGKRVVMFMDYNANQTKVPYILDEFSQMWETPFSPTNVTFPCVTQRPPNISNYQRNNTMYIANHNLNVAVQLPGSNDSFLIPNFAELAQTNSVDGLNGNDTGALGTMAEECRAMWNRPPRWLLVDFYNVGNGSVFEVAAQMNGVEYNRPCCGLQTEQSKGVSLMVSLHGMLSIVAVTVLAVIL